MKKTAWILALTITAALLAACRPNPATPVDTSPETAETAVATVETDPVTAAVTDGPESSLPETQPGGISDPETAAPDTQSPETENPGQTPEPTALQAFYASHHGLFTARNGLFVSITEENGRYYMMFSVWNAGGPFPAGEIVSVEKAETPDAAPPSYARYRLHLIIGAVESSEEVDGWEAFEMDLEMEDLGGEPFAVAFRHPLSDCSDVFYSHEEEQYPSFFEEMPVSPAEFGEHYLGFWTAPDGDYIQVSKLVDGQYYLFFGNWNTSFIDWNDGEPYPAAEIRSIEELNPDTYQVNITVQTYGKPWYDTAIIVEHAATAERAISFVHLFDQASEIYYFHEERGYPESLFSTGAAAFVEKFRGTWTDNDKSDFVHFSEEDGHYFVLFGVWYSGGEFPVADILSVEEFEPEHYDLVLRFRNGSEEEWEVFNPNDGHLMIGKMGSEPVQYFYDGRYQFPGPPEV